jgi:hypothetical protein
VNLIIPADMRNGVQNRHKIDWQVRLTIFWSILALVLPAIVNYPNSHFFKILLTKISKLNRSYRCTVFCLFGSNSLISTEKQIYIFVDSVADTSRTYDRGLSPPSHEASRRHRRAGIRLSNGLIRFPPSRVSSLHTDSPPPLPNTHTHGLLAVFSYSNSSHISKLYNALLTLISVYICPCVLRKFDIPPLHICFCPAVCECPTSSKNLDEQRRR